MDLGGWGFRKVVSNGDHIIFYLYGGDNSWIILTWTVIFVWWHVVTHASARSLNVAKKYKVWFFGTMNSITLKGSIFITEIRRTIRYRYIFKHVEYKEISESEWLPFLKWALCACACMRAPQIKWDEVVVHVCIGEVRTAYSFCSENRREETTGKT
jgi:hypothetical protein